MKLSAEHELFRDSVRAFVRAEIAPHVNTCGAARTFPRGLYRRVALIERGTRSERICREVKVMMIGGGTEEIMKELAARRCGA